MGAGLSAQFAMKQTTDVSPSATDPNAPRTIRHNTDLQNLAVPSGMAPWVNARVGIRGDNEVGLTYSGRSIRIDGRHAWSLGRPTLSVGLGASALMAERPGQVSEAGAVYGGGLDLPVLIGVKSTNDLYALWLGPRAGFEVLNGQIEGPPTTGASVLLEDVSVRHFHVGFVAGLRAGFRHVHVAIELGGAFHRAFGSIGDAELGLSEFSLMPGGALIVSF